MLQPINTITFRQLLATDPSVNNAPDISTPDAWKNKRQVLNNTLQELMGESSNTDIPPPQYTILNEQNTNNYLQLTIAYLTEPDEEVRAHLLIPHRHNGASVLCLHGTSVEAKDTQLGASAKPNRDWARFLSDRGFITLSPDHVCSGERFTGGERPYDTSTFYERHPQWSAMGKAVWDGKRALDILLTVGGVDKNRIGCIGHSLGGYGTIWVAAFDERINAAVSSCGLTTWQDNPRRYEWAREQWYVHLPQLKLIFQEQEKTSGLLPVEMHEYAALIAPRPFLNISGMIDKTYGNNETMPEVGLQLNALWDVLGESEKFAQFLMGAPHDVPHYSRLLALGWMEKWLGVV
jgi:cephalosporin-C deacetylase-like acetyl esterase